MDEKNLEYAQIFEIPLEGEVKIRKTEFREKKIKTAPKQVKEQKIVTPLKQRLLFYIPFAVLCVLIIGIFAFNIFASDSELNNVIRSAFFTNSSSKQNEQKDNREYNQFNLAVPTLLQFSNNSGVLTITEKGGIYAPEEGVISAVSVENDKYTIEITHNSNLKTIIKGAEYAFGLTGDRVYKYLPVAYTDGGATISFISKDVLLNNYTILNGTIVWAV